MTIICCLFICFKKQGYLSFDKNKVAENSATNSSDSTVNDTNNDNGNVDTFVIEDYEYGKVTVTGYAYTEERTDSDTGEKFQYVLFKITESSSDNFMKYIESMKGNSYVSDKAIGLGCFKDGIISYNNVYDDDGGKGANYKLSSVDSIKIINSSSSNLIRLNLLKNKLITGGSGYNCSSLIARISVIDN